MKLIVTIGLLMNLLLGGCAAKGRVDISLADMASIKFTHIVLLDHDFAVNLADHAPMPMSKFWSTAEDSMKTEVIVILCVGSNKDSHKFIELLSDLSKQNWLVYYGNEYKRGAVASILH